MRLRARLLVFVLGVSGALSTLSSETWAADGSAPKPGSSATKDKPAAKSPDGSSDKSADKASGAPKKKTAPAPADLPPRPPPFKEDPPFKKLAPIRRLDIGGEALLVNRLAADYIYGTPSNIAYRPTIGFGFHARLQIIRYLQIGAYFAGAEHGFAFGPNALGIHGSINSNALTTLWFGMKVMPTLPIGERVRLWTTLGLGWGRFEFPQMTASEPGKAPFLIKGRGNSFVEFPMGIGASFEIIKNWLSVDVEITGAPMIHKKGTSFVPVQALDNGHERTITPLDESHLSIVQSLGLSLLL